VEKNHSQERKATSKKKKDLVKTTIFIWLQLLEKLSWWRKIVKATKMIVIFTDTVVVCIGTERDCQCHRYLLLWQINSFFRVNDKFWRGSGRISLFSKELHLQRCWTRGDNLRYPVYTIRHWYPAGIRLISLISGCWIQSKHGCFQWFFKFITLWPRSSGHLTNILVCPEDIFDILPKSVRYLIKSGQFSLEIRLIDL